MNQLHVSGELLSFIAAVAARYIGSMSSFLLIFQVSLSGLNLFVLTTLNINRPLPVRVQMDEPFSLQKLSYRIHDT